MTNFFFDIEAGGFYGSQSSIYSLAHSTSSGDVKSYHANPAPGSYMYQWAKTNVWEEILKQKRTMSTEEELIKGFIKEVGALPSSTTIEGWNIGYNPISQSAKGYGGFDMPMLATRAEKYGLLEDFQKAVGNKQLRDVGQEYAVSTARVALQNPDLVDPDIYRSAVGLKKALANSSIDIMNIEELPAAARVASSSPVKIAGWKQSLMHEMMFGETFQGHVVEEDVRAGSRLAELPIAEREARLTANLGEWNRRTVLQKAINSAKYEQTTEDWTKIQDKLKSYNLTDEFDTGLRQMAEEYSVPREKLSQGLGIGREEKFLQIGKVLTGESENVIEAASRGWFKKLPKDYKVLVGIAGLGTAAVALGVGGLFSGKDDEYNTIEGFKEEGLASDIRKSLTDFGSGYQGDRQGKYVKKRAHYRRGKRVEEHYAYYKGRISGKDDAHNTIEGLREEGIAGAIRKVGTEFGSGYKGPNPWLHPEYNQAEDVPRLNMMRASKLGVPEKELYKYFTEKEEAPEWLMAAASAGTALHLLEGAKKYKAGLTSGVETFEFDSGTRISGHIDIVYPGNIPSDIKTVSWKRYKHLQKKGAFERHVSQLNWYMNQLGAKEGLLEYVVRDKPDVRKVVRVPYSQELYDKDIQKLEKVRAQVRSEVASGQLDPANLPKTASLKRLQQAADDEVGETARNAGRINFLEDVFAQEMDYLNRVKRGGKDDNFNTIEGLRHQGVAGYFRKHFTDFGSGWDALRSLVRAGETFEDMIGSSTFQKALKESKTVKRIGEESAKGEVFLMSGNFRGQELSFARKFGKKGSLITESEIAAQKELQNLMSPTVYNSMPGFNDDMAGFIDMELFTGRTFRQMSYNTAVKHQSALESSMLFMHSRNIAHGDLHPGNVMLVSTPYGKKAGIIDFGATSSASEQVPNIAMGFTGRIDEITRKDLDYKKTKRWLEIKKIRNQTKHNQVQKALLRRANFYDHSSSATARAARMSKNKIGHTKQTGKLVQ